MKVYFYACDHDERLNRIFIGDVEDPPKPDIGDSSKYANALAHWANYIRTPFIAETVKNLCLEFGWDDAIILDERSTVNRQYYVAIRFIGMG